MASRGRSTARAPHWHSQHNNNSQYPYNNYQKNYNQRKISGLHPEDAMPPAEIVNQIRHRRSGCRT
eukprot:5802134-Pyramimonas_sp.AAC.1